MTNRLSGVDSIRHGSQRISHLFRDLDISPNVLPYLVDRDVTDQERLARQGLGDNGQPSSRRPLSGQSTPGVAHPGHYSLRPEELDELSRSPHLSTRVTSNIFPGGDDIEKQGAPPFRRSESTGAISEESEGHPKKEPSKDPHLIEFSDLHPNVHPQNWKTGYKWAVTTVMAVLTLAITFASSMFSTAAITVAYNFDTPTEVTVLGTSLYVLGFAFGPICWGPMSELFGRRLPLLLGVFGMCVFQIGVAVAQNLYTIFLCRFFAGLFGSSPLAVLGGAIADIWDPTERGAAMGLFAVMTFAGPVIAPVIGGFVDESYLGWRWTEWLTVIFGFFCLFLGAITLPETYAPSVLQREARRIKYETKNWAIHAKADEELITGKVIIEVYMLRPFKMFVQEPILILITLYMSLVYGILYLFFVAFPISFNEDRGWSLGVGALPFLSLFIGIIVGGWYISYWSKTVYNKKFREMGGKVPPEARLPPMFQGGIIITVGLFWWAWSSFPDVNKLWVSQCLAGIPVGAGIMIVFVQSLTYLVDCYLWLANSAIAANTFFRSLAGAGFPLFATAMFHTLNVQWATSLLAFLCMALIPVPIFFWKYGKQVRMKSKFVPNVGN